MKTLKLSTIAENGERPIKVGYKAENEDHKTTHKYIVVII